MPHAHLSDRGRAAAGAGRESESRKRKRVLPPISKSIGGSMPGVDITDPSALAEIEDLDQVMRMQRFR
jgi:hypothetical protein